jgi:hypothetical protein
MAPISGTGSSDQDSVLPFLKQVVESDLVLVTGVAPISILPCFYRLALLIW